MKARKDALDADVVVVNHHLFFADVMLRDEGLAELLPACNTVILDEAHQLPDTATLFFGEQTTAGQLAELARDAEVAARTAARDVPELPDAAADLAPAIRKLAPRRWATRRASCAQRRRAGARRLRRRARRARRRARSARGRDSAHFAERSEDLAHDRAARRGRRAHGSTRWRDGAAGGRRRRRRRMDPLGRRHAARLAAARVAAVGRRHLPPPGRRDRRARGSSRRPRSPSAGDFAHYTAQLGLERRRDRLLGQPVRLRDAGAALRAARPARAEHARAHRCRRRRGAAGAEGERRPRVPAVHDAARARRARASAWPPRSRAKASTFRCWCRAKARRPSC